MIYRAHGSKQAVTPYLLSDTAQGGCLVEWEGPTWANLVGIAAQSNLTAFCKKADDTDSVYLHDRSIPAEKRGGYSTDSSYALGALTQSYARSQRTSSTSGWSRALSSKRPQLIHHSSAASPAS